MAIPNPLVITYNAVAKNLPRINQDSYGSEYFLKETTQEFRVRIRHSKEAPDKNGISHDRHNVELTMTIYAVSPATIDEVRQVYVVMRNRKTTPSASIANLGDTLSGLLTNAVYQDLANWVN
jgi:hypothetical protein